MAARVRKIVLASRNEDKLRELRQIYEGKPFEVVSALDYAGLPEIIEDGTSALGNATRKALVTAAFTGEIAVADDTSFQVRSLNDLPDVFASRFAGPGATYADNAKLVLELMSDVPDDKRQARFTSAMVWVDPRPRASLGGGVELPMVADHRWLHNPYARAVEVKAQQDEDGFWNDLTHRDVVWANYHTRMKALMVSNGVEVARARAVVDRLVAPFLGGGRPSDAPTEAVRLPDPRLWTVSGPTSAGEPPTRVAPSGLPADAPGRTANETVWLELSTEGRLIGNVARQPIGTRGFGYDPIFVPEGDDRTLAEYADDEKNAVSHRGRALRRLLKAAGHVYGGEPAVV